MKRSLFAAAAACALAVVLTTGAYTFTRAAPHSPSTAFPSLTTIYVVTGVLDSGTAAETGFATVFQCSNVSGVTTSIRFLVLSRLGAVLNTVNLPGVAHGATVNVVTHNTVVYTNETTLIDGTGVNSGVVNIESLQSAVFCTAAVIDASDSVPYGITPHIVRVNPHPGTVE